MAADRSSIDLTNCDREPIHIPGAVQPHGVLLAVNENGLVAAAAGPSERLFGRAPAALLGIALDEVIGPAAQAVRKRLTATGENEPAFLTAIAAPADASIRLDVIAHKSADFRIFEFEMRAQEPLPGALVFSQLRTHAAELEFAQDLPDLYQRAAVLVRRLTGFDRVMVYRFLADGAGVVAGEDKAPDLAPFLHHHYPASDIPQQARALYLKNLVRVIADVNYEPAPLVGSAGSEAALDMTDCVLRSVSPVHIEYLRNMNVAASTSVSIVVNGRLWGLIACHHGAPKFVPYELREACKLFGLLLGRQIDSRADSEHLREAQILGARREEVVFALSTANAAADALKPRDLMEIAPCDGAAIVRGETVIAEGSVPADSQIRDLARFFDKKIQLAPFATHHLSSIYGPAGGYAAAASGLLAACVPGEEPISLLWFRKEIIQTIKWAGNPEKPAERRDGEERLSPRKSFDMWKQTVREKSSPWSAVEIDGARRFAQDLHELRSTETLRLLNRQLQTLIGEKEGLLRQKDLLMQEANHRVQNSLQLVIAMLDLQSRQADDEKVRAQFAEAMRRIMAVAGIHRRLWKGADLETVEFCAYLSELRDSLIESWGSEWERHVQVDCRRVLVPTDKAVKLALIVAELMTNSVKHAYKGEPGAIGVRLREENGVLRIEVSDSGAGMQEKRSASGSGFGRRLIEAFASSLGGTVHTASDAKGTRTTVLAPLTESGEGKR